MEISPPAESVRGEFSPQKLVPFLSRHPLSGTVYVAFSGGVDSSSLLHALARLIDQGDSSFVLEAIHVNHGLQSESGEWAEHCRKFCEHLNVPLHVFLVDATPKTGESPEESARKERYRAFARQMQNGDQLFTAHHQEDQAETFLLQALRGAGPRGLAAMGMTTPFDAGQLMRPLLHFSQQSLQEYALREELEWIEDPTNQQQSADRNFIRHEILPRLKIRWPAAALTLSRSSDHCAEASQLVERWAEEQLTDLAVGDPMPLLESEPVENSKARIRYWLEMNGAGLPDAIHLHRIIREVINSREDAVSVVRWKNRNGREVKVRRFQGLLYMETGKSLEADGGNGKVLNFFMEWDLQQPLYIPETGIRLVARTVSGVGIRKDLLQGKKVTVRSRVGGERCHSGGSRQRRTLKNLLRERGIPPWERGRIPLIFVGDNLAQVVGHFICDPYSADKRSDGKKSGNGDGVGLLIESMAE